MNNNSNITTLSRADRWALGSTIGMSAIGAIVIIVLTVQRIAEIVPNRDVPILASFVDATAKLPIGPDGSRVSVDVDRATILVSDMPDITLVSLVLASVVSALAALIVIVCLCLFCRNLIAGRAFGKQNTWLVLIAALTVLGGWVFGSLFTTMGMNGGFAALSRHSYDGANASVDFVPLFVILALGAVGAAFQVGARLQRDTEGLV